MPIEIKELKIKAVINTQPAAAQKVIQEMTPAQTEKWKKEIIREALHAVKEYLKEQTER